MTTRRTTYALRALVRLAQTAPEPQHSASIAAAEGIPKPFLEVILRDLCHSGLVQARRGRHGGYTLKARAEDIDLASVVRSVDGPWLPFACADPVNPTRCSECPGPLPCPAQLVLSDALVASSRVLEGTTLADLVLRARDPAPRPQMLR